MYFKIVTAKKYKVLVSLMYADGKWHVLQEFWTQKAHEAPENVVSETIFENSDSAQSFIEDYSVKSAERFIKMNIPG